MLQTGTTAAKMSPPARRWAEHLHGLGPHPSVTAALAYSDLFDYPLTLRELHRYQAGTSFTPLEIQEAAWAMAAEEGILSNEDGFFCLCGREVVFSLRRKRMLESERIWKRARIYGRWLARAPFVRMVAVTGALAVDNIAERPDIDFMVVAEAGRVWVARRLLVAHVRIARLFGDELCPNYILADSNLDLQQRDLFTAHELSQMVPLHGRRVYRQLLETNDWARHYLPMGFTPPDPPVGQIRSRWARTASERFLRRPGWDGWERWELERLRRRLRCAMGNDAEVVCTPEQCKGHTSLHRRRINARYRDKLAELGIYGVLAPLLEESAL